MNIEDSIKLFNETYPKLLKEDEELTKRIVSIFEKKLDEIRPIIRLMKDNHLYFFHPELSDDIKNSHGVILGRSSKNAYEIYVFGGMNVFLQKIDAYNDKVLDNAAVPFQQFFRICDLNFAIKGIEYVKNYLQDLLETFQNKNDEKRSFIEKYDHSHLE